MPDRPGHYHRHRYPAEIISHAVWLYHRFALSRRDVQELPFERGVVVSYETVRAWVEKFGERFAAELRWHERQPGRTWHLDEIFTKIRGQQVYLWRAVDEHGQVLDVLVQEHRDADAAERFFRRQRFLATFSGFCNHFRIRPHLLSASEHRTLLYARFQSWRELADVCPVAA